MHRDVRERERERKQGIYSARMAVADIMELQKKIKKEEKKTIHRKIMN